MKTLTILTTLFILCFITASIAFAQDTQPPATAAEGLNLLAMALASLIGLAGNRLVDWIKSWPYLTDGEKSKLGGLAADLVTAVLTIGLGYGVTFLAPVAAFLDQSGLWQVIIFSWPFAKGWYEVHRAAS